MLPGRHRQTMKMRRTDSKIKTAGRSEKFAVLGYFWVRRSALPENFLDPGCFFCQFRAV